MGLQPAQAADFSFQVLGATPTGCSMNAGSTGFFMNIQYTDAPAGTTLTGTVVSGPAGLSGSSTTGAFSGSSTQTFGFTFSSAATPDGWSFVMRIDSNVSGANYSMAQVDCSVGNVYSVTPLGSFASATAPTFSGPALPAGSNLVLITGDIGVQQAPDGEPTGEVLRKCQTAFVYETSEDGRWYRVFIMGGWIPVNATRDVAENYGQKGGEGIDPFCG